MYINTRTVDFVIVFKLQYHFNNLKHRLYNLIHRLVLDFGNFNILNKNLISCPLIIIPILVEDCVFSTFKTV